MSKPKHLQQRKRQEYTPQYEDVQTIPVPVRLSRIRESFRPRVSDFELVAKEG